MNNFSLIGAAIDACAGTVGSKDTPYIINEKIKPSLTFKEILDYTSTGKDLPQIRTYFTKLATLTKHTLNEQKTPIIIGGDHSCAIGSWSGISDYLNDNNQNLGLIWIDAHMDSHTFETSPSGNIHGMPIAALLGHGSSELTTILNNSNKIDPQNIILIGIRSYEDGEAELLKKLGVKIYYNHDLHKENINSLIHKSWNELDQRVDKIGFSIDLDGFDPLFAPGVGTREPDGVNFNEFLMCIKELDLTKLIGVEITEGNQHLDQTEQTMDCIIKLIGEFTKYGTKKSC